MDVTPYFQSPEKGDAGLSALARGVVGSEILRIAGEIRAMQAKGLPVCNLTVGDFDPKYFPIPKELLDGTREALEAGQTNYPPAEGILPLREAVVRLYERDLGLSYPVDSVVIAAGARPLLYGDVPHARRSRRHGDLPRADLEQQPLRVPVGRSRRPGGRLGRVQLLPDARPAPPAPRRRRGSSSSTRR